jgi:RecA-family ATPase
MPEYFGHLGEELQLPREEVQWTIRDVFPTGANVTLTAQYKAGKTTLINSLARSLADGEKFLNYFDAPDHPGRIVIFNYEVNREQYRRWFDDVGIKNVEKVSLYHMKGSSIPLLVPHIQDLIVDILKKLKTQTWILDPFAGAFTGSGDENSNSDVTVFLNILDIIKERAGVSNLVIPIHTGRAQEHGIDRARGATRLDDWADVRWLLKKTQDGRFFSADGRDVLVEEQALAYNAESRSLTFGGADAYMTKKYNK